MALLLSGESMNIPQTGPSSQKAKFFSEIASAFTFLSVFYSLSKERQLELLQIINKFQAQAKEASESNNV